MKNPKFEIPQEILTTTIESMREFYKRLEVESSIYQQMNTHEGRMLADDRLMQAAEVKEAYDFFLGL